LPVIKSVDHAISPFGPEASEVMHSLRCSIAAVLAKVGDFGKPADVYKGLHVDRTLARQLFHLASTSEALGNGGMIPSRTSIERFLAASAERGASASELTAVRDAYRSFEQLVQTHAGDRATFNSMVAAASGLDADWHAADLQHRRNAFRAMSHTVGVQAKTRVLLFMLKVNAAGSGYDAAAITGFVGLRVLRSFNTVRVSGITADPNGVSENPSGVSTGPLGLSNAVDGYVLEEFSSTPLPAMAAKQGPTERGHYREIVLDNPTIGNAGASTLMFGTVLRNIPRKADEPLAIHAAGGKPVETLLLDALTEPNFRGDTLPYGHAVLGNSEEYHPEVLQIPGNFNVEYLGKGPRALATPEVPRYADMARATGTKLGWNANDYDAWRIRVEFPIYQGKISLEWPAMSPDKDQ
jgi:hypothetical protein